MCKGLMSRGVLVAFEGLDRSGKSSQCELLKKYFETNLNQECLIQRFPDRDCVTGHLINQYLRTSRQSKKLISDESIHLIFSSNRWEKKEWIENSLLAGKSIILDRYAYSGVAYSFAKGNLDFSWCKSSDIGLPEPDIIFFLNAENLEQREDFGEEVYEEVSFQKKVRLAYELIRKEYLSKNPVVNKWKMIDSNKTIDNTFEIIKKEMDEFLLNFNSESSIAKLWK